MNPNEKPDSASGLIEIAKRMHNDQKYAQDLLSDYEFAKKELNTAGIMLEIDRHQELKKAIQNLQAVVTKLRQGDRQPSPVAGVNAGVSVGVRY